MLNNVNMLEYMVFVIKYTKLKNYKVSPCLVG